MITAINADLFTPEVTADPYPYFDRLREEDPVHWNEKYGVWIITRYDDVVWLLRHPELFSSEVFKRDPREPYPPIQASDLDMYHFVREFFGDFFIQHDRPEHTEMRKVVHGYFTPKSMEKWRSLVQSAITELLDEAEAQGRMDVMRDFATPLPLLVIAQMLGMPYQDRKFLRELSEKLIFIGRGEPDRMRPTGEAIRGLVEYLSPICWTGMRRRSISSAMARWPSSVTLSSGPCCNVTHRWQCAPRRNACATIPPTSRCSASPSRTSSWVARLSGRSIAPGGLSPRPIVTQRSSPRLRRLTSPGTRTCISPLGRASITVWGRPWRGWRDRRLLRPWCNGSPPCIWRRRSWNTSRASSSDRSNPSRSRGIKEGERLGDAERRGYARRLPGAGLHDT